MPATAVVTRSKHSHVTGGLAALRRLSFGPRAFVAFSYRLLVFSFWRAGPGRHPWPSVPLAKGRISAPGEMLRHSVSAYCAFSWPAPSRSSSSLHHQAGHLEWSCCSRGHHFRNCSGRFPWPIDAK